METAENKKLFSNIKINENRDRDEDKKLLRNKAAHPPRIIQVTQ